MHGCGILVPQSRIKSVPPALGVWSLNHWTTRQVLGDPALANDLSMLPWSLLSSRLGCSAFLLSLCLLGITQYTPFCLA